MQNFHELASGQHRFGYAESLSHRIILNVRVPPNPLILFYTHILEATFNSVGAE